MRRRPWRQTANVAAWSEDPQVHVGWTLGPALPEWPVGGRPVTVTYLLGQTKEGYPAIAYAIAG